MPLMHTEDQQLQKQCIEQFQQLVDEADDKIKSYLDSALHAAKQHRDIILQFGRFPHRNIILKRKSTSEESLFLTQPNSSF